MTKGGRRRWRGRRDNPLARWVAGVAFETEFEGVEAADVAQVLSKRQMGLHGDK